MAEKERDDKYIEKVKEGLGYEYGSGIQKNKKGKARFPLTFDPPNPASVIEEKDDRLNEKGLSAHGWDIKYMDKPRVAHFEPKLPASVIEDKDEKSYEVLDFLLKYWSDEGDTILAPSVGCINIGIACKNLNRKFIGIELDNEEEQIKII